MSFYNISKQIDKPKNTQISMNDDGVDIVALNNNNNDGSSSVLVGTALMAPQKKTKYCGNCGKKGHLYKHCKEPITSMGIIGLKLDVNELVLNNLINDFNNIQESLEKKECLGILIDSLDNTNLALYYQNKLKFLLISRKHSVGFMEFIRGRYEIDNMNGMISLFKQMISTEFDKIRKAKSFIDLWKDVWIHDSVNPKHKEEFKKSKDKFDKLKKGDTAPLNLDFYLNNVKPSWKTQEWGFPKGRKNLYESNIDCANREFVEETSLKSEDYLLFDRITPFEEQLIGTDGVNYKHIYYLGIIKSKENLELNHENCFQNDEIGDIGYFTYEDAIKLIRPYHVERKSILTHIYIYIMNLLIKKSK